MKNSSDERLDFLFAAARSEKIDTSKLENHFETRLMARIAERRAQKVPWYALAWRLVPAFAVVAISITVCTLTLSPQRAANDLFASLTTEQDEIAGTNYLLGE